VDANIKPQECKLTSKINEKEICDCGNICKVKKKSWIQKQIMQNTFVNAEETCHRNSFHRVPSSLAFQGIWFYWRNSDGEDSGSSEPSKLNLIREGGGLGWGDSVAAVALSGAFLHMLHWMRLLHISVHWTCYWRLLLPLLVAGMHILYSKDIWTKLQIRVVCLENFQCWFSMTLCLVICPYSQKLPTSGISPLHFLITCDWIDLVLFCHRFFLSFRIVLTGECDKLGCKLSFLFLTHIYSKLYASLQSHCFSFLFPLFFYFLLIYLFIYLQVTNKNFCISVLVKSGHITCRYMFL